MNAGAQCVYKVFGRHPVETMITNLHLLLDLLTKKYYLSVCVDLYLFTSVMCTIYLIDIVGKVIVEAKT